jgi:hypothetical protein
MRSSLRAITAGAACLLLFLVVASCSPPARSQPLQVTYYYLPG